MSREKLPRLGPVGVDQLEKASQAGRADAGSAALGHAERDAIRSRRERYGLPAASDVNLFGLALSGGGIRSATFALGVLQAMAARDLLKHVDYLSTVSGGGYIGSSLLWWLSGLSGRTFGLRPYRDDVGEAEWFPYGTDDPSVWRDRAGQADGPRLLRNLKENGNYLTPGRGINVMSLIAVVLRGVVLNLLFWLPPISLALGLLHATGGYGLALWLAVFLALLLVLAAIVYSLATGQDRLARRLGYKVRRLSEKWAGRVITVAVIAALVASIDLAHGRLVAEGGQMTAGALSTLGGLAAGLVTYFRTMRGAVGSVRKLPGMTTRLVALLAAALIVYGVLLLCHGLTVILVDRDLWRWGLLVAALLLLISVAVNINHISVHRMYRDRLMEAFMPAFAPALRGRSETAPAEADGMRLHQVDERNSPFPILNANLLLVDSKERRRKLRGGDSFVLTPRYCGSNATGWVDCRDLMHDDMTLPSAMAISGAAANPNTGSGGVGLTRSRLIAVLMAFTGLRLGYWLPNFGHARPPSWLPNHVWPGLSTVLPLGHDERGRFLELSDGGHFENLGLYELVRRRVRLIVLCDAAQDPDFAFEDLQRAQRRIAADFGAVLELTPATLERLIPRRTDHRFPESDLRLADSGHVVGRIRYSDGSAATLIYLKTTLIDDLPLGLLGYRGANPTFPDQSTTDQFFDEEQFEAYRELGFITAERMMRDRTAQADIAAALGPAARWEAPAPPPTGQGEPPPATAAPAARSAARRSRPHRPDR
ncbi:MAG TPA: patatin-like phospholipase family protein [Geminicoccaceae bacterium]|nr:patatin-like phospholipase family protein [Geminicoccaceae bacterium]